MSKISVVSFGLNMLLYLLISIPILVISRNKKIYKTKNNFLLSICIGTIIEIVLSILIYKLPGFIFSRFVSTPGIINYSIFISKIVFSTSSLIAIKILVPFLIINQHKTVRKLLGTYLLVTIAFCTIGFLYKKTVGFLFGFPISDLVIFSLNSVIIFKEFRRKS